MTIELRVAEIHDRNPQQGPLRRQNKGNWNRWIKRTV